LSITGFSTFSWNVFCGPAGAGVSLLYEVALHDAQPEVVPHVLHGLLQVLHGLLHVLQLVHGLYATTELQLAHGA
jgi:hypothetical protein